jgi:hypothetical protein
MEVIQAYNNFSEYIPNDVFTETNLFFPQIEVEISHWKVFHDNVNIAGILKCLLDACEKIMISHLFDNFTLQDIVLFYLGLVNYLHGITLLSLFLFCNHYASK